MDDSDFQKLCESIKQAGEIMQGKGKPSRTFVHADPDPQAIRKRLGLSQSRFAAIIGVSVRTLQNWEQGRRHPEGPAKALLRVVDKDPEAVLHALHAQPPKREQCAAGQPPTRRAVKFYSNYNH